MLDHPELATHVTQALRLARYRIWRDAEGLWLDDGWGVVGRFDVVYTAPGTTPICARGHYRSGFLPSIHGQAVVVIEYGISPAEEHHSLISPAVTGCVKLDSGVFAVAGLSPGPSRPPRPRRKRDGSSRSSARQPRDR